MKNRKFMTRLYLMYIIALVPLILFGLYKNGIELYSKGLVDFLNMFKPLIILLMGLIGALVGSLVREVKKAGKFDISILDKCKCDIVEAMLVVAILPLSSSPIIVFLVTFAFSLMFSKLKVNRIVLEYILIEGSNVLFGLNNFHNAYEINTVLNYNGIDLFFGSGAGGIFATNILFILIALVFLSFNKLYKKEMVYSALVVFLVISIVPFMIRGAYTEILPFIFGYNFFFILVFIAPNLYSSSYTVKGQILSGVLIGLLTYGLYYLTPYTSCLLAVLIVSLLKGVIDRIFVIK